MSGIRRAPRAPIKPRAKPRPPLHQRILGRSQVELDTLDDLETELEQAYKLDLLEYDTYLNCWEALTLRREKAKIGIDKATGRYIKPQKGVINVRRQSKPPPLKRWQVKLLWFALFCILFKVFG